MGGPGRLDDGELHVTDGREENLRVVLIAVVGPTLALWVQHDAVRASCRILALEDRILEPVHEDCLVVGHLNSFGSRVQSASVHPARRRRGVDEWRASAVGRLVVRDERVCEKRDLVEGDVVGVGGVEHLGQGRGRVRDIGDERAGVRPCVGEVELCAGRVQEDLKLLDEGVEDRASSAVRRGSRQEARAPSIDRE